MTVTLALILCIVVGFGGYQIGREVEQRRERRIWLRITARVPHRAGWLSLN